MTWNDVFIHPQKGLCLQCEKFVLPPPGTTWEQNFSRHGVVLMGTNSGCRLCALVLQQLGLSPHVVDPDDDEQYSGVITVQAEKSHLNELRWAIGTGGRRKIEAIMEVQYAGFGTSKTVAQPRHGFLGRWQRCSSSGPEQSLQQPWDAQTIKSRLFKCQTEHSCTDPQLSKRIPTRLLDVGMSHMDTVKLINTKALDKSDLGSLNYVALSYCWGLDTTPFTTTSSSLVERERGFAPHEMPKTLRDAVQVTRDLGFRYLWIDALCIIQSEGKNDTAAHADWKRESVRMNEVYGGACLTIVAAGASDCDGGLFQGCPTCNVPYLLSDSAASPMKGRALLLVNTSKARKLSDWARSRKTIPFHLEPIAARAWAFQEWVLSRRLLVFCMDRKRTHFVCDQSPLPTIDYVQKFRLPNSAEDCKWSDWPNIVMNFSGRNLSKSSDKLPAISGVAKRYGELTGRREADYLAGLWRDMLPFSLLWQNRFGDNSHAPICYRGGRRPPVGTDPETGVELPARAPSWSWAAVNGPVDYEVPTYVRIRPEGAQIIRCDTEPEPGLDRFGQIRSGTLVIRCRYILTKLVMGPSYGDTTCFLSRGKRFEEFQFFPDDFEEVKSFNDRDPTTKFYCLLIARHVEDPEAFGIVVWFHEAKERFMRVGMFDHRDLKEFDGAEEREFEIW